MTSDPKARDLEGKVAVITGSVRGIGRETAIAFGEAGASVVVNGRKSAEAAETIAREVEAAGGKAVVQLADVTDPAEVRGLIEAAVKAFGRLDILVNCVSHRMKRPVAEMTFAEWRDVLSSTLDSAFLCINAAVPHIRAAGGGTIINVGGVSGHAGVDNRSAVAAAKAGLAGMTGALAVELAPSDINVNCVSPGSIDNYLDAGHTASDFHGKAIPMGRLGTTREVAALIRFLCGPDGHYICGQTIHVSGAWNITMS